MSREMESSHDFDDATKLNNMVDSKIIDSKLASNFSAEDVDRFVGYFDALNNETEIRSHSQDIKLRDGYLSDQCAAVIKSGDQTRISIIDIIEYFGDERPHGIELEMQRVVRDSNRNLAIEYRPDQKRGFVARVETKGGINPESNMDPAAILEACAQNNMSSMTIELPAGANEVSVMKIVDQVAKGYETAFEEYQLEMARAGEEAKASVINFLRQNKQQDDPRELSIEASREVAKQRVEHITAVFNQIIYAIKGDPFSKIANNGVTDRSSYHTAFRSIIEIFGPKDAPRQVGIYNKRMDKKYVLEDPGVPDEALLQGCRLAEIGGNFVQEYQQYGAKVTCPQRSFSNDEHGGIKGDEQITLENYETTYPDLYDISMSRNVMDANSGVEQGFDSSTKGSVDLLAVFANMTKPGGLTAHEGTAVPDDESLYKFLGLEHVFTFTPADYKLHITLFRKIDSRKISPDELAEFLRLRSQVEK